jgi:hypothetical protein
MASESLSRGFSYNTASRKASFGPVLNIGGILSSSSAFYWCLDDLFGHFTRESISLMDAVLMASGVLGSWGPGSFEALLCTRCSNRVH